MKELIQQHKEICSQLEKAVSIFNDKYKEAENIRKQVIQPLREKLTALESKMYQK